MFIYLDLKYNFFIDKLISMTNTTYEQKEDKSNLDSSTTNTYQLNDTLEFIQNKYNKHKGKSSFLNSGFCYCCFCCLFLELILP